MYRNEGWAITSFYCMSSVLYFVLIGSPLHVHPSQLASLAKDLAGELNYTKNTTNSSIKVQKVNFSKWSTSAFALTEYQLPSMASPSFEPGRLHCMKFKRPRYTSHTKQVYTNIYTLVNSFKKWVASRQPWTS